MRLLKELLAVTLIASLGGSLSASEKEQPNVLWIVTDDHRYDTVRAFNKIITGQEHSELGYVESPQTDRLVRQGTTFINTYCHSPGCAPSRAAMHLGRYPFRSGVYEFEYHNSSAPHWKPTFPEQMADLGYQTFHVGKLGVRLKQIQGNGKWTQPHPIYQQSVNFKKLGKDGLTAWGKDWFHTLNGVKLHEPFKSLEYFVTPEGKFEYCSLEVEKKFPELAGTTASTIEKYDLLRHYKEDQEMSLEKGMIISGVSPRPAGQTRDGFYTKVLKDYLNHKEGEFKAGSQSFSAVDPSKPLLCHLGFDFPHTPVLPPADYRARFQKHTYQIPEFDQAELATMPKQMKKQVGLKYTDHLSAEDKHTMIQDYFAFCAYGDTLIGEAADSFIDYSERHKQEWMIVYVHGDHGWKLNDHGAVSKFTPWQIDTLNPIVVVSSDKKNFPAGKVVKKFTEFVDIAPTILAAGGAKISDEKFAYLDGQDLAEIASGKLPARDYIIGESHAVTGPRAFIRTKDYVFSMQTRPDRRRGKNMTWAKEADYKELDPGLYHMPSDPKERKNLAFDESHQRVAQQMKEKLINIVLGDNRVEVNWGGNQPLGTEVFRSNFAPGSHDGRLKLAQ